MLHFWGTIFKIFLFVCFLEIGSGWTISPFTAVPVKGTLTYSLSSWTAASQLRRWTVTTGPPFTMPAGEFDAHPTVFSFLFCPLSGELW